MEMLTLLNLTNQKRVSYVRLLIMLSLIITKTFKPKCGKCEMPH